MGKITRRGLAKPDDPIFSTGPEISANHSKSGSSAGPATPSGPDDPNRPETEEDGIEVEKRRRLKVRRQMQAAQERAGMKGATDGPAPSPNTMPEVDRDPKVVAKERELFEKLASVRQYPVDEAPASAPAETSNVDKPPRDLLDLIVRRHGVSREKAQQMLDDSGY